MNTDHFIALYDMENYIWTMIMASWTPLIIHDSYELQTSMISDHSKWGFIRFTRSMITHDCYEHWLWAITVHRNSYEFGFWTINDQTHHTWWGGINAMKCWCSYMINTDSVSYYDPYNSWRTWLMAWRLHFMWIFLTLPIPDFPTRRKIFLCQRMAGCDFTLSLFYWRIFIP